MTWPRVQLGTIADIQLGKMLSPKARTGASSFPYLRNVNVQWGRLDFTELVEMDFDEDDRARFALKKGDLLVCEGGEPGRCAVVECDLPGVFFQKALMRVRPCDDQLDTRFLQRFMAQSAGRGTFAKDGNQATIAHFPAIKLNALEIPVPPLPEQRRIADILDKADAVRRKRKEAIALTEELLRSAFLEMFGDPVTNPKGWPVKQLRQLLAMPLRNGLSPASGGAHAANVLTLSAITRGRFDETAVKHGAFAAEPWDDVRVDERDFLICRGNGNLAMVGTGAFPISSDPTVVFPDTMIAARVNENYVSRAFLTTVWKSRLVRQQIDAGARTTNGTFKVNQTLVESVSIPLPELRQQHAFDVVASYVSKLSENLRRSSEHSSDLFDSLVGGAFRGKLWGTHGVGEPQLGLFDTQVAMKGIR